MNIIILRTLIIVFLSLFITDILIQLGLFEKFKFIGKYFTKITKLPEFYSITFVTSFGSSIAANTMLASLQNEGKITKEEVFIGALFNSIPVYIKETFQYQIPIIIPILGGIVGIIYFSTFLLTGFFKFLVVIFLGRKFCRYENIIARSKIPHPSLRGSQSEPKQSDPKGRCEEQDSSPVIASPVAICNGAKQSPDRFGTGSAIPKNEIVSPSARNDRTEAIKNSFLHTMRIFSRIAIIYLIISYLTFLLTKTGYISELSNNIIPILKFFKLPECTLIPTTTFILSPLVGVSSLGALIKNNTITQMQGAISALIGSFLFLPVFAIRSTLPNYTGIFGIKLGILILTFSTLLGMLTRALVIFLILVLWR